jgi:hypothetical protein
MNLGKGISCNDFKDSLADFIDGTAAGEGREALDAHLTDCPDCRLALERERGFFALLDSLDREPAPAGFAKRTLDLILPERAPARSPLNVARGWSARLMMAAAIVFLVGALGQWFSPGVTQSPGSIKDTAALALVEGSRGVPTALEFFEQTGDRIQQVTGPAVSKMNSLLRAERTVRAMIPPGALALFLLVSLTPLVLLFTVYRLRVKGALSHVLVTPSLC